MPTEEMTEGVRRLSELLGEELARGIDYDRKVYAVIASVGAAPSSVVEQSRQLLPDLWSALDDLVSSGKRAPAYH